jgi:tRNA-specific 2-thiouridylase
MAERVVVAMSGGVDSSVAAALLVEQGYEVVGVTLRVWPWAEPQEPGRRFGACCSTEAVEDARRVARRLGIPHYVLDSAAEFERRVVEPFVTEYRSGRTPVPCLACNHELKFGSLLRRAAAWDAVAVATGHYARLGRDPATGRWVLRRARDREKDQTHFLWSLTQAQLARARFPVGELTKDEVRAHARRLGLPTADKPDSQELCFVPHGDYRTFLRRRDPGAFRPGPVVDRHGRQLGVHGGLPLYTVGQRRGLGLATGRPLYVLALDPATNTVVVGEAAELERTHVVARGVNFVAGSPPPTPRRIEARVRHRQAPAPATLQVRDATTAEVEFEVAQRAVAPGQSVVFYEGDVVLGGGVIAA